MTSKIKKQKLLLNFIILVVFWTILIIALVQLNYKEDYNNSLVRLSMPGDPMTFSKYVSRVSSMMVKPSFW